ncbi:HesB/YadR/YfhF family protein [Peribacillus kribbensis]|uniref:HesB/YadR/YfhF family protein n=1 Tax=Peribacillus kribbensis TaxID=356658 RepID=UPI0003F95279|nr:HesB/YadR/YfhF family protein [Peribacillus kribbensis]
MEIKISDEAAKWYEEEMDLKTGDFVRFLARYGGCSTVQSGFSLGISKEEPINPGASSMKNGVTYFIEESDLWYFDNHNLEVGYNVQFQEPEITYGK